MLTRAITTQIGCQQCNEVNSWVAQKGKAVRFSCPNIFFLNKFIKTSSNDLLKYLGDDIRIEQAYDLNHLFYECRSCGYENHQISLSILPNPLPNGTSFVDDFSDVYPRNQLFVVPNHKNYLFMVKNIKSNGEEAFDRFFITIPPPREYSKKGNNILIQPQIFDRIIGLYGYQYA